MHDAIFNGNGDANPTGRNGSDDTPPGPGDTRVGLDTFDFHHTTALRYVSQKEFDRALKEFEQALAFDPKNLKGLLDKGDCQVKRERPNEALVAYREAAKIHPNSPRPHLKIGNLWRGIWIKDKKPESFNEAVNAYKRAVNKDADCKEGFNNLGVIHMQNKQVDEAANYFEKALEKDPDFADAHMNFGILNEEYRKRKTLALYHYRRYVQLEGPNKDKVKTWIADLDR